MRNDSEEDNSLPSPHSLIRDRVMERRQITSSLPYYDETDTDPGSHVLQPRDIPLQHISKSLNPIKNTTNTRKASQRIAATQRPWSHNQLGESSSDELENEDHTSDNSQHRPEAHVVKASESKDLTIHLELNVVEDIELDLDEFSRLAKLGNFNAANSFFFDNLQEQMDNAYVSVQYAQMLLDMGDYAAVEALRTPHSLDSIILLHMNWSLVRLLADLHIKGVPTSQVDDIVTEAVKLLQAGSCWGSTEVQVLSLVLRLLAHRYPSGNGIDVIHLFDWVAIYNHLLLEGRIWDFRDLFVAFLMYNTQEVACLQFLLVNFNSSSLMDTLVGDWLTETFDEPTSLALLDIMAALCLGSISTPEKYTAVKRCLDYSRSIASSIAENDASLLMTGPYLRWSLAKARVATYRESEILRAPTPVPALSKWRLYRNEALDIPFYVPIDSEFVDWKLLAHSSHANDSIQTILNASRQLGDYTTESIGRQILVYRSEDPLKRFDELISFQKSRQHDFRGCLHSILAKYVACKDQVDRKILYSEILMMGDLEVLPTTLRELRTTVQWTISGGKLKVVPPPHSEIPNKPRGSNVKNQTDHAEPRDQESISKPPSDPENGQKITVAYVIPGLEDTHGQELSRLNKSDTDSEKSFVDAAIQIRDGGDNNTDDGDNVHSTHVSRQSLSHSSSVSSVESGEGSPTLLTHSNQGRPIRVWGLDLVR
ncbi:hypothetical protein F4859DRAFT_47977 [Xylaria cf. heliscus]|nr:hypothetical protein F4859DRAFT_47977 [Xylaria cf. heliscus]